MLGTILLLALLPQDPSSTTEVIDERAIQTAGSIAGLTFTEEEAKDMVRGATRSLRSFEALRARSLDPGVPPALVFQPLLPGIEPFMEQAPPADLVLPEMARPQDLEELAFASIAQLASLIRSRRVSCVELTTMFLERLERIDRELHCVISFTRERALAQARERDAELDRGHWRGMLHGIPWGAKDLLAVAGTRTTWGAKPYEDQVIEGDAAVVRKLDEAGAILIAKLTLGALAMGDVWFGGKTRNPWNPEQGSSGSSAGSAAATAAGAVPFAIGSETLGSIVSPSTRCGNSSLRPTFGRVSRTGAMALCWSMDKLGPLCRSAEDAAIVFEVIQGPEPIDDGSRAMHADPTVVDLPFVRPGQVDVRGWKVGYVEGAFRDEHDRQVLEDLRKLGCELVPFEIPEYPVQALRVILNAESAAAFDELTREDRDDLLVRQDASAWPNLFRTARLIPAVEYLRANRLRVEMMHLLHERMRGLVALVHPSFAGDLLTMTNLTGHPTFVAPNGFRRGTPTSISFTSPLFGESKLLALVMAWQRVTDHHEKHPPLR